MKNKGLSEIISNLIPDSDENNPEQKETPKEE